MENNTVTVCENEHFRVQLDLFDLIEPCPAPAVQPTDHPRPQRPGHLNSNRPEIRRSRPPVESLSP